jgi:hypothetical protein
VRLKHWKHPVLVLGGLLSLLGNPGLLRAAPDANGTLSVRPVAGVPPAAINDLVVSSTAIEGQLRLDWTAPAVFPGSALDSYQIRVQTFSVTDVGGSTTTWWSASGGILIQGLYGESPGQAVIRTLGPAGSSHSAGLYPGATYYLAVRSADDLGVPRDFWSDVDPAQVLPGLPLDTAPSTPSGLAATAGISSIGLSWTGLSNAQKGLDFDYYQIYRSTQSGTGFVLLATTTATAYSDTAVSSGTAYYYELTAIDRGGPTYPGYALESAPTAEVSATPTGPPSIPLRTPNGLLSTSLNNGLQAQLDWSAVTRDLSGTPVTIASYVIYRYDVIGGTATTSFVVPAPATTYTDNTGGIARFYRIQAVSSVGGTSALSDNLDSAGNRYALASDDITTRVVMPHDAALYLLAANNPYGEDLYLTVAHQPQDETNVTLRSYRVTARRASTDQEVSGFAFPQNNIAVELGYGAVVLPAGGGPVSIGSPTQISAATLAQIISVYWFNGASYIRVGNPLLTVNQSISVTVRNLGIYQIRAVTLASKFRLSQGSPYPRVITPNGAENHRVFWFFENPSGDTVSGDIYDIRGAHVRALRFNSMSPTANSLVWDGRDDQGAVVPSGVYLYKISTSDEKVTGTVVVAR